MLAALIAARSPAAPTPAIRTAAAAHIDAAAARIDGAATEFVIAARTGVTIWGIDIGSGNDVACWPDETVFPVCDVTACPKPRPAPRRPVV